jgi:hypothetical protein
MEGDIEALLVDKHDTYIEKLKGQGRYCKLSYSLEWVNVVSPIIT